MEMYPERFPRPSASLGDVHSLWAYCNGRFFAGDEAAISVWDHGLLYGDAVFEGIRAYSGHPFRLQDHLDRLWRSAASLQMTIPLTKSELSDVVLAVLERNELADAHVKVLVTRGIGPMGMDPRGLKTSSLVVYAYPYPPILGTSGVTLITAALRRKSPHSIDSKIKSTNYLDNILAKLQANASGADDALMLDTSSFVAEATSANVFVVYASSVSTPFCHAALEGITRNVVIGCLDTVGVEVLERNLTLHDIYTADEVFLTGTAAEIVPVRMVDGRVIGSGQVPGPITSSVRSAYADLIASEVGPSKTAR